MAIVIEVVLVTMIDVRNSNNKSADDRNSDNGGGNDSSSDDKDSDDRGDCEGSAFEPNNE